MIYLPLYFEAEKPEKIWGPCLFTWVSAFNITLSKPKHLHFGSFHLRGMIKWQEEQLLNQRLIVCAHLQHYDQTCAGVSTFELGRLRNGDLGAIRQLHSVLRSAGKTFLDTYVYRLFYSSHSTKVTSSFWGSKTDGCIDREPEKNRKVDCNIEL